MSEIAERAAREIQQLIICDDCKTRGIPGTKKFNWPLCDECLWEVGKAQPLIEYVRTFVERAIEESRGQHPVIVELANRAIGREDVGEQSTERQQPSKLHNEGSIPSSPSISEADAKDACPKCGESLGESPIDGVCIDCWPGYNLCKACNDYRCEHIIPTAEDLADPEFRSCHCGSDECRAGFVEGSTNRIVNRKEFAAIRESWKSGELSAGEPSSAPPAPFEAIRNALSKLESQIFRNPKLPESYRTILKEAYEAVEKLESTGAAQEVSPAK